MRIYLPATIPGLARARDQGSVEGEVAYAVTPAVREWYVDDDVEDLEFSAMQDAAQASLALLVHDASAPRLRLVVAADVPEGVVKPVVGDEVRSKVRLSAIVDLGSVVSLHIDESSAQATVSAAVKALPAAEAGDEDAEFEVGEAEGCDLLWYDITELDDLIG